MTRIILNVFSLAGRLGPPPQNVVVSEEENEEEDEEKEDEIERKMVSHLCVAVPLIAVCTA